MPILRYLFLLIAMSSLDLCWGQENAEIQGRLLDTTRNFTVSAASVSLYKIGTDEVYRLVLSAEDGQFTLQKLRLNQKYRLRIQHQRYEIIEMEVLPQDLKTTIGSLYLRERVYEIEEVAVLAPVRMNGDTIEFNADAFKLDSNAVAGDLLTKLPGITIWGDEEITYNGKKINQVLVNGKPFFSVSSKIALGNLPKNSIEKVQIYTTEKDNNETKDINLVLKKGKERGIFGKLGAGLGTREHNEGEAAISAFNSANQLSIGALRNNVNKPLKNLDMLMGNTTFGGVTIKDDYFPDMRRLGDNSEFAWGARYQHDLIPQQGVRKKNHLVQDIFYKDSQNKLKHNTSTRWMTAGQSDNRRESSSASDNRDKDFLSNFKYVYDNDFNKKLNIRLNTHVEQKERRVNSHAITDINKVNYEEIQDSNLESKEQGLNLETSYAYRLPSKAGRLKWFHDIKLDHILNVVQEEMNNKTQKLFYRDGSEAYDRNFKRNYTQDGHRFNQDISIAIGELLPTLFDQRTKIGISQGFAMLVNSMDRTVLDSLQVNNRLSFAEDYQRYAFRTGLSMRREFVLGEVYRVFKKSLSLSGNALLNTIREDNKSGYTARNFGRNILMFQPSIGISYQDMVEQTRLWHIDLDWSNKPLISTLEQLRPIVDDINLLNLYLGNPNLENGYTNSFSLRYRSNSFDKLPRSLVLLFTLDIIDRAVMESVVFTDDGRREVYLKNNPESQIAYLSALNYSRAIKFSQDKNMTAKFNFEGRWLHSNQELSEVLFRTSTQSYTGGLDLGFQLSSGIKLGLKQNADLYFQRISGQDVQRFENNIYDSNLSVAFRLFKRTTFNANASYLRVSNNYEARGSTIINSSITFRLLKGDNLEVKLSANDILNNNSGLFSKLNSNYITYGDNNIIKQYFLISLAYFPRFF